MPAGYLIRRDQAQAERSAAPCDGCGHPHSQHTELAPHPELIDGTIVMVDHPDRKPFVFHCRADGCECTIDRRDG